MNKFRALPTIVLAVALASLSPAAWAQDACLSSGEGRQLLEQGQVVPFPQAMREAGLSADQVVEVQLCQSGGGYVYRVRVLEAGGQIKTMDIPAG